ncbi:hypothetical protein [Acetohalobium arabaticum]|uniref:Uncharacterized protein n=1 Tax=Acetohalobium arabaticum (strain ATCC 49924 / DSM 5501 / Z-7288) TaxID=574087 RepID=D9QSJ9_ACEAZ|nr:hypothetical protein [Acetohalobium arabaticum]ADL13462.1 hypothetical protein Acear_1964 [Acetohalobium arabaticum DSM 5501]
MILISDLQDLLTEIDEKNADGFCFEVRHKILEIPRNLYLETLSDHKQPLSEEAVQHVVEEYLDWKDEQGLPGMIRINDNQEENQIELDAAVRYLVSCEENSCDRNI